ncbi:MAG: hypothetical protein HRT64_12005 [Erythrobacter sp.]|nr:hypothetical protein [Erythrobacter sp.]
MLKMIDERAERTDQLLSRVQDALPDAQAVSERIDRVIDERLAASESRIQELIDDAERRAAESEQRAIAAIEQSKSHADELETLGRTVDEQLNALRQAIETNEDSHANYTLALQSHVDEAKTQIEQAINEAFEKANIAGKALESRATDTLNDIETRIERVNVIVEPLVEASDKAMRALGMDPEAPVFEDSPLARIESLVDRGEVQLASLDRVYRQLEDLQTQAESVRSAFGTWLNQAADEMDSLENRKTGIVGPMRAAAELVKELGPDIEQKMELASTELSQLQIAQKTLRETIATSSQLAEEVTNRMGNQSGQLQALVDGSVHKLSTRVEQAGVWLGSLIQRAEALGATLPGAGTLGMEQTPVAEPTLQVQSFETQASNQTDAIADQLDDVQREVEELRGFTIPEPPGLPIDALSFDGSAQVYEHKPDSEDQDS